MKSIRTKKRFREPQNENRDEVSAVSTLDGGSADSESSISSRFHNSLAKLFGGNGGSSPSSSALPRWENPRTLRTMTAPPISSTPSAADVIGLNKLTAKPHAGLPGPKSTSFDRRKREDAHVARLLNEAKNQQNINLAFGNTASGPVLSNAIEFIPRLSHRPSFNGQNNRSGGGPVDIDSGVVWSAPDGDDAMSATSRNSSRSFKTRGGIASSLRSGMADGDHSSIMTGATPRISNLSPPALDEELPSGLQPRGADDHDENYEEPTVRLCRRSRSQAVLGCLAIVLVIAVVTVVVSLVTTKGDTSASPQAASPPIRGGAADDTISPSLNVLSQSPSLSPGPSTPLGSIEPITLETISRMPSIKPSRSPASVAGESPSQELSLSPTALQSIPPSLLITQSLPPSVSPSALFHPDGQPLLGQQESESFGQSISLNGNGTILAVGAPDYYDGFGQIGRVDVFRRQNTGEWVRMGQSVSGRYVQGQLGSSLALSDDGAILAVSEEGSTWLSDKNFSVVRVFLWSESSQQWTQRGNELTSAETSRSLSLSADGKRIAVGSPLSGAEPSIFYSGQVHVFDYDDATDSWMPLGQSLAGSDTFDRFGSSVSLSPAGDRLVVGAPGDIVNGGYVKCFDFDGVSAWNQVGGVIVNTITPLQSEDRFGSAVSLDGDRIAVGSPRKDSDSEWFDAGLVSVYQLDGDWIMLGNAIRGETDGAQTGTSVQLRDDYLIIGSPGANDGFGTVSFYRYDGTDWVMASLPLSGEYQNQGFGDNIASDRNITTVAVGSPSNTFQSGPPGSVNVFSL